MHIELKEYIRPIPDFPKPGILFQDISPLLQSPEVFQTVIDTLKQRYAQQELNALLALDARGFIFGAALSYALGTAFIPVRKQGKLPGETFQASYEKEYGEDHMEIQKGALQKGDRVLVVDDLIATGGTAKAACELAEKMGADVVEVVCMIELVDLKGREQLKVPLHSLVRY